MKKLVFCDFDGTVTRRDVGYHLYHHFSGGESEKLIPDWKAGKISSRECLRAEAALVKADPEDIYRFLDTFEITAGFDDFIKRCRVNDIEPVILSDGQDFYIKYILEKHGLNGIKFISNIGRPENRTIVIEFPHNNTVCTRCGNCKGERIAEFRAEINSPTQVVFIGDGLSDICALPHADIIFAKKDLEKYCLEHKITYNSFKNFNDVVQILIKRGFLT